jgi:predicted TIM-barrel fold metal-dependent hydrolase
LLVVIDIHGHIVAPPELYAYKAGLLAGRGVQGKGRLKIEDEKLKNAVWTGGGEALKHIDVLHGVGTDLQLISPRPYQMMHSEKPERIVRWYTEATNDLIAQLCRLHPRTFGGVAGLPQNAGVSPKNSLEELGRCVKELGFVGCLLNPDPNEGEGTPPPGLGEEYWYPLYEKLVELDVPAMVHAASSRSLRETYSLHFIQEETTAIVSLLNSRVFADFPALKLVICHGGGAIPYQIGRFRAGRYRRGNAERFEDSIRRLYFDTCIYTKESLELLFKVVGPDRCMFGTERPGTGSVVDPQTGRYMDDLKPVIESIDWLSKEDRKKIFEDTARKVFRLSAGEA